MATREELLALLSSRRRGLSIRPAAIGPTPTWLQWLDDDSHLKTADGPERLALVDVMAQRPLRGLPTAYVPEGRWARLRGLFRQGWGDERQEGRKLRYGASVTSVLFNFFFAAMLLWLTYLQFLAIQPPPKKPCASASPALVRRMKRAAARPLPKVTPRHPLAVQHRRKVRQPPLRRRQLHPRRRAQMRQPRPQTARPKWPSNNLCK